MKLVVKKNRLDEEPELWLRRTGYALISDRQTQGSSFVRRLTRDFYPRFHVYITEMKSALGEDLVVFNLHLDQKRPAYAGYNRHNAEYDGEVIEMEAERLKNFLLPEKLEKYESS